MIKRIIFIAVMCAFMAVTARADIVVTPYTYNLGTTQWTNTTAAVGSSSLELNGYPADSINYAGARVANLGGVKVKDFASWDYWTKGPQFHGVNFVLALDTPYDNYSGLDYDLMVQVMPYNTLFYEGGNSAQPIPGDTWVNLDSSQRYPYNAWSPLGGYDIATQSNAITWTEFQNLDITMWGRPYDLGEATVLRVTMRMGGGGLVPPGGWGTSRGYLDDFTLNGIPVTVENGFTVVPVPAAVLLGMLGFCVAGLKLRKLA